MDCRWDWKGLFSDELSVHQVKWRQKLKQRADGKSQLDEMSVLVLSVDCACNLCNTFLYQRPLARRQDSVSISYRGNTAHVRCKTVISYQAKERFDAPTLTVLHCT